MASSLTPEGGTMVGLLTAAGVYLIYNNAVPNVTDIRAAQPHNADVESARKGAAWKSAVLIGLVFVIARDVNSYIISGAALIGIDYLHKHANAIHPATGKVDVSGGGMSVAPTVDNEYAMPNYSEDSE